MKSGQSRDLSPTGWAYGARRRCRGHRSIAQGRSAVTLSCSDRAGIGSSGRDPHPLVFAALVTYTSVHISRVGAMLKVAPTSCVRAVSNFSAHSWSVLASPHTWLEVMPRSRSTVRNGRPA